ncbi:carbohydrate-binding protein [Vallitalea guaymasensis]|uniref:CBM21 domain-containing protein n=1 Tax=Vallitalea guaymasensis TaxID=1185412 RepID=A0A8J8MCT0_9FIRM|nr:carbohydrate-binding protein [Vallitalea guaymasensis]QUH30305.1 hypothetical protein HYG85_15910 [Vallitalea guaymasensis]
MKRKYFRNLVTFMICFVLALNISCFSISAQTTLAETTNVQLYSAKILPTYGNIGNMVGYYSTGKIYIKDLGANKNVTIHYTYDDTNWLDQPASYQKTLEDGSEVWTFKTPEQSYTPTHQVEYNCKFAVKYEVDGNTYWDNNNGDNYFLQDTTMIYDAPFVLSKSVVMLDKDISTPHSLWGFIFLKNLAYDKKVIVRYTTDNWATYHDLNAHYNWKYDNDIELWSFDTMHDNSPFPVNSSGEYAIGYTVDGVTYWDNNFGDNYSFSPSPDSSN